MPSALWKNKRLGFIEDNYNEDDGRSYDDPLRRYMCDRCGWNWRKDEIEVHHKHHRRFFGAELRGDVMVVCKGCHEPADEVRARQGRERSQMALESAIYDSGFETWITKRHGEDAIHHYYDSEIEHERFQDFLERKADKQW